MSLPTMSITNRILSLSMRPKSLSECIGQEDLQTLLENQFNSGRIPHFYIICGEIGSGKTTIARILALALQMDISQGEKCLTLPDEIWNSYKKYQILEINAANKNGIDDLRTLVENMKYKPIQPSRARVVIMDEAHQITNAAQNMLLTETEDVLQHVYYIFCTSTLSKIIPALQRRAYILQTAPLRKTAIQSLVQEAAMFVKADDDIVPLVEQLYTNGVRSPGLILQAAEKYFNGVPVDDAIQPQEPADEFTKEICRAITKGNWKEAAGFLKSIKKTDVITLRLIVCGYLKTVMMNTTGLHSVRIAKAIQILMSSETSDNIPLFLSSVCLACNEMTVS